ncbi:YkvA family protein [Cystobacter fuscus]
MDAHVKMKSLERWKQKARALKTEVAALLLAVRHPSVPWYAKLLAAAVVAYALSPVDLIPDFIPVLGYLDDLILLPLGILLVRRLIPPAVLAECREQALRDTHPRKTSWIAGAIIIALWAALGFLLVRWWWHRTAA